MLSPSTHSAIAERKRGHRRSPPLAAVARRTEEGGGDAWSAEVLRLHVATERKTARQNPSHSRKPRPTGREGTSSSTATRCWEPELLLATTSPSSPNGGEEDCRCCCCSTAVRSSRGVSLPEPCRCPFSPDALRRYRRPSEALFRSSSLSPSLVNWKGETVRDCDVVGGRTPCDVLGGRTPGDRGISIPPSNEGTDAAAFVTTIAPGDKTVLVDEQMESAHRLAAAVAQEEAKELAAAVEQMRNSKNKTLPSSIPSDQTKTPEASSKNNDPKPMNTDATDAVSSIEHSRFRGGGVYGSGCGSRWKFSLCRMLFSPEKGIVVEREGNRQRTARESPQLVAVHGGSSLDPKPHRDTASSNRKWQSRGRRRRPWWQAASVEEQRK
nr:hypothetical protein Itr_chr03CG12710 [Ipomoea trifida]